jgi:hypothetical protein
MLHLVLNHRRPEFVSLLYKFAYPVPILETASCDDFGLNDEHLLSVRWLPSNAQSPSEQHQSDDSDIRAALFGNRNRCTFKMPPPAGRMRFAKSSHRAFNSA